MYELEIQKYLRSGKTLENLKEEYFISPNQSKKTPELYSFKYSMIESPLDEKIACEARSLVLNSNDNWNLVCQGFEKFFNYGEGRAPEINWNLAEVQEKVDGSLITAYVYNDKWQVCTTGTPDADCPVGQFNVTFSDLFFKACKFLPDAKEHAKYCFMFELTSPYNKVVVDYKSLNLTTLGGRCLNTGNELDPNYVAELWKIPRCKTYLIYSIEEAYKTFSLFEGSTQEGYVISFKNDRTYDRVKLKHPGYVSLHHLKSSFSFKNMLNAIRIGEIDELRVGLPEFRDVINLAYSEYEQLIHNIYTEYLKYKDIEVQKDFALTIKDIKFKSILFNLRKTKLTEEKSLINCIKKLLSEITIDSFVIYFTPMEIVVKEIE